MNYFVHDRYFVHNGSLGDIVYSLPTIVTFGGGELLLRGHFFDAMYRLLSIQPYIIAVTQANNFHPTVKKFNNMDPILDYGGRTVYNLDLYRNIESGYVEQRYHLAQSHLDIFGKNYSLKHKWLLDIEPKHVSDIVVARSTRYHDSQEIDWKLLIPCADRIAFVGKSKDYREFVQIAGFSPRQEICNDALDMAEVIKGSKLFIGNQSLGFALAEAMKHPRVLETYYGRDNCHPNGNDGYNYLNDDLLERYL